MEGIEKLEKEIIELNNPSITKIFDYLKTRTDLYDKFNNDEKSLKQMYEFIYEKARKHEEDHVAMIEDQVVYMWAITYFMRSNEELNLNEKKSTPPTAEEKIKKINKKHAEEEEKKKKEEVKKKEEEEKGQQLDLFQEVNK